MPKHTRKQWLTDAIVEALQPTPDRAYEVADGKPGELGTGLRVRVERTGTKSFKTAYKFAGQRRTQTLGQFPVLGVEAARDKARNLTANARAGVDPEPDRQPVLPVADLAPAFADHIDDWLENGTRNAANYRARIRFVAEALGPVPIGDFPANEFRTLVADLKPSLARTTFDATRAYYNWLLDEGHVDANSGNPVRVARAERERQLQTSERYVRYTDEEIRRVWAAAQEWSFPHGCIVQLAMLTGTRSDFLTRICWSGVNDSAFELPKPTGRKRVPLLLPITDDIRFVLDEAAKYRRADTDYVFWRNRVDGVPDVANHPKVAELRKRSGTQQHIKSLQKTMVSRLGECGIPGPVRLRLKGLVQGGVAAHYDEYDYLPELRDALERYAAHLRAVQAGGRLE